MKKNNLKYINFLILLLLILVISFSFFTNVFANCDSNHCNDCLRSADCSNVNCGWDTAKNKCCGRLELAWPQSPAGSQITACSDLTAFVKYFYEWGIVLGGLVAFISLVIAGFKYLTSVGDYVKMADARNQVISAIAGLILLLASFLILNTLNPELTVLRIPKVEVLPGGGPTPPTVPPPDIKKSCNRIHIWNHANCTTTNGGHIINEGTIGVGSPAKDLTISKEDDWSIQIASTTDYTSPYEDDITAGQCLVELWKTPGCPDNQMVTLTFGCINTKTLGLNDDVRCIKVEKIPGF